MGALFFRSLAGRRRRRRLRLVIVTLIVVLCIDAFIIGVTRPVSLRPHFSSPTWAVTDFSSSSPSSSQKIPASGSLPPPMQNYSIYLASVHRNTGPVLHERWNAAIVELVQHLGPDRVFVSAVEGGSQDWTGTKEALSMLDARLGELGVPRRIVIGRSVWEQLDELADRPVTEEVLVEEKEDEEAGGDANGYGGKGMREGKGKGVKGRMRRIGVRNERTEGWIWNAGDEVWDMRRIPYLSRVRNEAMKPLYQMWQDEGRRFDRIVWINDVVFNTSDILTLLSTRNGAYAAACSMDFQTPPAYYDTFALRDSEGDKAVSSSWPWFASVRSRVAAINLDPIPTKSCWNGIVAFDAAPFYSLTDVAVGGGGHEQNDGRIGGGGGGKGGGRGGTGYHDKLQNGRNVAHLVRRTTSKDQNLTPSLPSTLPVPSPSQKQKQSQKRNAMGTEPGTSYLEFRGIPDSLADLHLEGSECCLIHADNPLSTRPDYGVWVNPRVRVGYNVTAYNAVHAGARFPPTTWQAVAGVWAVRWGRAHGGLRRWLERDMVRRRLEQWVREGAEGDGKGSVTGQRNGKREKRYEPGDFCLINEMQIMWSNGWKHL